jgi:hypothetical protein
MALSHMTLFEGKMQLIHNGRGVWIGLIEPGVYRFKAEDHEWNAFFQLCEDDDVELLRCSGDDHAFSEEVLFDLSQCEWAEIRCTSEVEFRLIYW